MRKGLVAFALVLAGVYAILPAASRTTAFREVVQGALDRTTAYEIRFGDFRLTYDLDVEIGMLRIAVPRSEPFFRATYVRSGLHLGSLASGRIGKVLVGEPVLFVNRLPKRGSKGGGATDGERGREADAKHGGRKTAIPFDGIEIRDGWVRYGNDDSRPAIGPFTLDVDFVQTGEAFELGIRGEILFPGLSSPLPFGGNGTFEAAERTGSIQLQVEIDDHAPSLNLVAVIDNESRLDGRAAWSGVDLSSLGALSRQTDLEVFGTLDFEMHVEGGTDALRGDGRLQVSKAAVSGATWGLAGDLDLPFTLGPKTIEFSDPGLRVENASGIVKGWEWKMEGATAHGTARYESYGVPRANVRLATRGLEFHDEEFLHAGEAIALQATVDAGLTARDEQDFTIESSVSEGGLLWKRLYLDLARLPVSVRGDVRRHGGMIEIGSLQASVEGIGMVEMDGRYRWPGEDYTIAARIDLPGLTRLYDVAVRETFEEIYPFLARTEVDGHLSAALRYDRAAAGESSLSGRLRLAGGKFSSADPSVEIRELEVDLPIDLGDGPHLDNAESGTLKADTLRVGDIELSAAKAALLVERNRMALQRPVDLRLLGGKLVIRDFVAEDLSRATRHAECAVRADGLDLAALSRALGWPELMGSVTGVVPKIRIDRERLSTQGEIDAQLLGGTARIRGLRIEQLFSPVPAVGLDLSFDNISLGQLTGALEIGHVTGSVRGNVRDLVLVNGQPLRFEADVTTKPMKGVSQRISVAAIQQLSILGGAGGDPITQGILGLFDEYRYSKMGFRCRLHNDRFILRGVEEFGGKDYLVVGATFPPRVHVISHNQTVDFSQMMRRIDSAFTSRSEPTTAP